LRFFLGGGLRIYFTIRQNAIVLLLAGGDKDTQKRDVALAKQMLKQLLENQGTSE